MPVMRQVLIIFAGTNGYLDKHPLDRLQAYETQMFDFMEKKHPEIIAELKEKGKIEDSLKAKMQAALTEFEEVFTG